MAPGKESTCNVGVLGSIPGLGRYPGEGKGYPLQYSDLENSIDSPRGHKELDTTEQLSLSTTLKGFPGNSVVKNPPAMQETCVWSLGREDTMKEEMATYSSIFARKILWTEESGRLRSMGSQRVGHDLLTEHTSTKPLWKLYFCCFPDKLFNLTHWVAVTIW